MAEFTPITTQEQLDAIITERIGRERQKYSDYETLKQNTATLTGQLDAMKTAAAEKDKQIKDKDTEIAGLKLADLRARITMESGLPYDLRNRLTGSTEEEIRADAQALSALIGERKPTQPAPLRNPESGSGTDDPWRAISENLPKGWE